MPMETRRNETARFRYSTDHRPRFRWSKANKRKSRRSVNGSQICGQRGGNASRARGICAICGQELDRGVCCVKDAGLPFKILDDQVETVSGQVAISTMHLAKGLEFRAVVVMACDDEIIPLQERIETVAEDADLEEIYNTERHLLYVACIARGIIFSLRASIRHREFPTTLRTSRKTLNPRQRV